jgi:hypothetical protein
MRSVSTGNLVHAKTEEQVVAMVRDFLGDWPPDEIASLPSQCRPGRVHDAEDVVDLAYELTRAHIDAAGPQELLNEMEAFFAQACLRLSVIETLYSRAKRPQPSTSKTC